MHDSMNKLCIFLHRNMIAIGNELIKSKLVNFSIAAGWIKHNTEKTLAQVQWHDTNYSTSWCHSETSI